MSSRYLLRLGGSREISWAGDWLLRQAASAACADIFESYGMRPGDVGRAKHLW
jgi:hypothetical protein